MYIHTKGGVFVVVCVFPAVAFAGATDMFDSVCVIEILSS